MKKLLRVVAFAVVAVIVVVLVAVLFLINPLVRSSVEKVGPGLTKTPVTLAKVDLSIFSGKGELGGLLVGNPEGFKTPSAIELGSLKIDLDPGSILSDKIVIRKILIEGPEITYEAGLKGSNIGRLLANIEGEKPAEQEAESKPEPKAEEPGKKVVIDDLEITGGRIHFSAMLMQGKSLTVPLPPIRLRDIGKEKDGASLREVLARVMGAVAQGVTRAVAAAGQAVGKGAEAVGDAAAKGAEAVGGAAVKGVEAVGGVAVKGAEAVGGTAQKGAEAAMKGLQGVVGGAKDLIRKD